LEAGSDAMKSWLDPENAGWSKELQSLLKPFDGELECYPVDKAVGKVGNNSPQFMVPIDSKENKNNIANFFGSQPKPKSEDQKDVKPEEKTKTIKQEPPPDSRPTSSKLEAPESNAPLPEPAPGQVSPSPTSRQIKEETSQISDSALADAASELTDKNIKEEASTIDDESLLDAADAAVASKSGKQELGSKNRPSGKKQRPASAGGRKMRSATTNNTAAKSPTKEGNAKITSFFGK
jgi:hypothetical protein